VCEGFLDIKHLFPLVPETRRIWEKFHKAWNFLDFAIALTTQKDLLWLWQFGG
jgi:hypothetical protein